jgi:hypothetical protein
LNGYEVLNIPANATRDEIRAAYRELARRWHPDRFLPGPERDWANEKMADINAAYRLCLNGLWKFAHAVNPAQVNPGFEQPEFDCRGWNDIHVPAHIQLEGWGTPQYANTEYPWDGLEDLRPGRLP